MIFSTNMVTVVKPISPNILGFRHTIFSTNMVAIYVKPISKMLSCLSFLDFADASIRFCMSLSIHCIRSASDLLSQFRIPLMILPGELFDLCAHRRVPTINRHEVAVGFPLDVVQHRPVLVRKLCHLLPLLESVCSTSINLREVAVYIPLHVSKVCPLCIG